MRNDTLSPRVVGGDERLLWGLADLMKMLGRSRASLDRDVRAKRLPVPIKLGSSVKWKKSDVLTWLDWGCPAADEFARRMASVNENARLQPGVVSASPGGNQEGGHHGAS